MTWGPCFMYYRCAVCGKRFKYDVDMIPVFGKQFGKCPQCQGKGILVKEGARDTDDAAYEEVE